MLGDVCDIVIIVMKKSLSSWIHIGLSICAVGIALDYWLLFLYGLN
jgi:hypothetical protein